MALCKVACVCSHCAGEFVFVGEQAWLLRREKTSQFIP